MNQDNKNKAANAEIPAHLSLTAVLSASLTILISVVYGIISLVAIIFTSQCDDEDSTYIPASQFFWNVIYRLYFQKEDCDYSLEEPDLMTANTVLIFSILTFTASLICLIAGCALIAVVTSQNCTRYLNIVAYMYVCCCAASLVIDITFGVHFAVDFSTMNEKLDQFSAGLLLVYLYDLYRISAFLLMTITFKGFFGHIVNITLLILILVYLTRFQNQEQRNEHSIHGAGALNAFEERRGKGDNWQTQSNMFPGTSRGPQLNPVFINDEDQHPRNASSRREPTPSDYSRSFDRSESWQAGAMYGSRPFSYLEESKRPVPAKPPMSAAVEPQWRREDPQQWRREEPQQWRREEPQPWRQENQWRKESQLSPPVPAPDYSPTSPRRLKSALKSSYM